MINNPYVVGNPVTGTQFYGRERIIETILYGPNSNLWVIGNRRVGKTSLLLELARRTANNQHFIPLFWDMTGSETEAGFVETLNDYIENDAKVRGPDSRWITYEPIETTSLKQALLHLTKWVHSQKLQLLFLCDEAETLLYLADNSPSALKKLRDILQNHPLIRPVLVSTRRLSRLYDKCRDWDTSLFLDGFASFFISNFRDETANQVIRQSKSLLPIKVDDSLLVEIRRATGNHPLLLQKLCSQLFDDQQCKLLPLLNKDLELDVQITGFLQHDLNGLTPDEIKLLRHISISSCTLAELSTQFSGLNIKLPLRNLLELGFLRQITEVYEIANIFLAEWLKFLPHEYIPQAGITNLMIREIAQEQVTSLYRQLLIHHRALNHLREQAAKFGISIPAHIQLDIDEHLSAIADIEAELTELGENIVPFLPSQSE